MDDFLLLLLMLLIEFIWNVLNPVFYLEIIADICYDIFDETKRYCTYQIITNKTLCDFFDFMVEMDKREKESGNCENLWDWIIYPSYNITCKLRRSIGKWSICIFFITL